MILNISNNHCRQPVFFNKIEQILLFLENDIKQTLSNLRIFEIFESNKRIILLRNFHFEGPQYCHFFIPEIENFNDKEKVESIKNSLLKMDSEAFNNYEEKRSRGENDSYICSLIQNDSIIEFISYINRYNISLSIKIKPSVFETNLFLIDKEPSLIEYAAFFGSIQIFQFLKMNNVELRSSLWLYTIHSNNQELIHILEENHVKPDDYTYEKYLLEAIKCHHNDVANYFENIVLLKQNIKKINEEPKLNENVIVCSIQNCNYFYFPSDLSNSCVFYNLGRFNYQTLVNLLLKMKEKYLFEEII